MLPLQFNNPIYYNLLNAELIYYPTFYNNILAKEIFLKLQKSINWQHDKITVFNKTHFQPRLTALYGDEGKKYKYSNNTMYPNLWTYLLLDIKNNVEKVIDSKFTSVLLNLYRDGKDSNGWHSDDEKELGKNPVIASLSFGTNRIFQLKHKLIPNLKESIILTHGSLLIMKGETQHFWKHQIPKTTKTIEPRINLTFRKIL